MNQEPRARSVVVVAGSVPAGWMATLAARFPALEFVRHPFADVETNAAAAAASAAAVRTEVLLTCGQPRASFQELIAQLGRLRWIHACSSGVDRLQVPELATRNLRLTRTAQARAAPMAEYVVGMTLALLRRLPETIAAQRSRRWQRTVGTGLAGATVGIVGAGAVGRAAARRFQAFEARTVAIRRRPGPLPCFDAVWGPERLDDLLPIADVVVLACALTPETHRLLGRARFAAMRPSAVLVNVARGAVIDEAALIEALASGRIGGAALDVFEREPLPADSPLWGMPNVIVTPHHASAVLGVQDAVLAEFTANLERYLAGTPLDNEVGASG